MQVSGVSYQNNYVRHIRGNMRVNPIAKVSEVINNRVNKVYDRVDISSEAYLNYSIKQNEKARNVNGVNEVNPKSEDLLKQSTAISAYQQNQARFSDGLSGTIVRMYI